MAQRKRTWRPSINAAALPLLIVLALLLPAQVCPAQKGASAKAAPVEESAIADTSAAEEPAADPAADETPPDEFAETDPAIEKVQALYDAPAQAESKPAEATQDTSIFTSGLRAFGALAVIVAVIILGGAIARKYLPKTPVLAGLRLGQVLGRVHLTPKASLYYVKTGGRVLVVGVTPAGIHLLTEFEGEAFDASLQAAPDPEPADPREGISPNFLEYLTAAQRPARPAADEDIANLRGEIQRLSEFLREASRDPRV